MKGNRHLPTRTVWLVVAALVAVAAFTNASVWSSGALRHGGPSAVVVLVLFFLAEVCVVHVTLNRQAHTCSLSEIPTVIGLVYLAPPVLLGVRLLGSAIALVFVRRQPWTKAVFNLAVFGAETGLAVVVYRGVVGGAGPVSARGAASAVLATGAALVLGTIAITLAMAVVEGAPLRRPTAKLEGVAALTILLATDLGLITVGMLSVDAAAKWVLLAAAGIVFAAYRSHAALRHRVLGLVLLYEATRTLSRSLRSGDVAHDFLEQARKLLRATSAELVVATDDGTYVLRVADDGDVVTTVTHRDVLEQRLRRLGGESSRIVPPDEAGELGSRGGVVAVVPVEDRRAVVTVADPLSDIDSFTQADRQLLETFANHAGVALSNQQLVEHLKREAREREHEALHDALTGLPNRTALDHHLAAALRGPDVALAVLLIDLDGFKEVNDTLGHHNGDVLLRAVADRITAVVPSSAFVSRMGGDEFAIVVHDPPHQEASSIAHHVLGALVEPFEVASLVFEVGASIGIAFAPADGTDSKTVLQRADVAMYEAKRTRRTVATYRAHSDPSNPARLALAAELRQAIENREILVEYQPKVALATGAVVGVEALARWHHPEHGFIPPDTFIPVAEAAALIRSLTEHVLDVALRQVRRWMALGLDLSVAVNVSPRNLADPGFASSVERILASTGAPPSALVLEIVETTLISESARTVGTLNRLSSMGVAIAIDDFGTGYSSLAYLHRLPVDELKIDRSFVGAMLRETSESVIVRSIIDLGHNLGLVVTAEGIEDAETWRVLAAQGCDHAQGYHLRRPGTAAQITKWLLERKGEQEALHRLLDEATRSSEPATPTE